VSGSRNKFFIAGIAGFFYGLLLFLYYYYDRYGVYPGSLPGLDAFVFLIYGIICGILFFVFSRILEKWISWKRSFGLRLIVNSLIQFLISGFLLIIVIWILEQTPDFGLKQISLLMQQSHSIFKLSIILAVSIIIINVFEFTWFSFFEYSRRKVERIRLEKEQLNLQFQILKSQLSPHFLFNNFNTIAALMEEDRKSAEIYIRRMVEAFEYILQLRDYELVTLKEEIGFVKTYLYLMKVRHGDSIHVDFSIDEKSNDLMLPQLTIQLLIENAIKHNYFSKKEPLLINVVNVSRDSILVENDKVPGKDELNSHNIGLNNINDRYSYFTENGLEIYDDNNYQVKVKLLDPSIIEGQL